MPSRVLRNTAWSSVSFTVLRSRRGMSMPSKKMTPSSEAVKSSFTAATGWRVAGGADVKGADALRGVGASPERRGGRVRPPADDPLADERAVDGQQVAAHALAEQVVAVIAGVERDGVRDPGGVRDGLNEEPV